MEYILHDTDILEEQIGVLFNQAIITNPSCFVTGKAYRLAVSFHVNLLRDRRFEKFKLPIANNANIGKPADIIYEVLGYQLHLLEQRLADNGVKVVSAIIQGEELEEEGIVKISMIEEEVAFNCSGKGKKKLRKIFTIMPSKPYISALAAKVAGKELGEIYWNVMNIVKDKKMMFKKTEDDEILFRAFVEQYRELWLAMGEKRTELVNRLQNRLLNVMIPK